MSIASTWKTAKSRLADTGNRITSVFRDATSDRFDSTRNYVGDSLDVARGYAASAYEQARKYANRAYIAGRAFVIAVDIAAEVKHLKDTIRERPLTVVGAAFGIGSLAGLLRRTR